ncbi:MAG: PaaI family thioesterase [Pseudomonadota bacterium]
MPTTDPDQAAKTAAAGRERVERLIETHFPQLRAGGKLILFEAVDEGTARLRMLAREHLLRPGGTVSGPSMFLLADVAVYAALLGAKGETALDAVTVSLTINFLSRPPPADLVATARLLKVGRRLAVGEVENHSGGADELVAHAMATYALPPDREQ